MLNFSEDLCALDPAAKSINTNPAATLILAMLKNSAARIFLMDFPQTKKRSDPFVGQYPANMGQAQVVIQLDKQLLGFFKMSDPTVGVACLFPV